MIVGIALRSKNPLYGCSRPSFSPESISGLIPRKLKGEAEADFAAKNPRLKLRTIRT